MFRTNIALRTEDAQTLSSKKTSRLFDGEWNPGGAGVYGIGALGPEKNCCPSLTISICLSYTSYQIIFCTQTQISEMGSEHFRLKTKKDYARIDYICDQFKMT
jgi:hypothetical protein